MGKKEAARQSKRKSDQALAPAAAAAEQLPARKRAKKAAAAEPAAAEPALAAQPSKQKKDQKKAKPANNKPGKAPEKKPDKKPRADKKPKADKQPAAAAEQQKRPKRGKKKQQQPQEEVEEEEEQLSEGEDQPEEQQQQAVHDVFMEEVHAKEAELNKHCLIMGQVETDEDETTLEELRGLKRVFVPEKVQEDFAEVWAELDEVGEDSEEEEEEEDEDQDGQPDILGAIMKAILGGKMLSTRHSQQMHAIFKTHQDQIDRDIRSKSWQEAFCKWAALLMAAHREKHWYEDTDMPQDAEAVCKRMQQQWKKLRARSDEELGGLVAEGDKSAKEEFDEYLAAVAEDMRTIDYNV